MSNKVRIFFMPIGLVVGAGAGFLFHNLAIGICLGVVVGAAIDLEIHYSKKRKK